MKAKLARILLLILAFCMIFTGLTSCKKKNEGDDTEAAAIETSAEEEYIFPDAISLSDGELNILNFDKYYNAIIYIDTEDTTSKVTKAVYSRNREFEETYGLKVVENTLEFTGREASFKELTETISNASIAGDDIYDIMYIALGEQPSLLSQGMLKNLAEVPTLQLDKDWWDKEITDSFILKGGQTYVASSPLNLMPYEMCWVILFNKQMATDYSVPNLFDTVRAGEWTFDKMLTVISESKVITPNADGGYVYDQNGSAKYGVAVHSAGPGHFLVGTGVSFIADKDDPAIPYKFGCSNTDNFDKAGGYLSQLFERSNGTAIGNDFEDDLVNHPDGYVPIFGAGDALFLNCEMKSGMTLKKIIQTNVDYGILPNPKLSVDQPSYITDMAGSTMMFSIPVINDEAEMTGLAADVLSYLSYRDVMPVYYGEYVSYQNANDPDSLDMLDNYIMPGRNRDKGAVYGWSTALVSDFNKIIYTGKPSGNVTLANILKSHTKSINTTIRTFYGGGK